MSIIKEDITFGRIALLNNMITEEQLAEVLELQKQSRNLRSLAMLLLEKEYINREQFDIILEVQKKRIPKPAISPQERREDMAFAFLAVNNNYVNVQNIFDCLQLQNALVKKGLFFRICELLLNERLLDIETAEKVLEDQESRTIECEQCKTRYNTIGMGNIDEFTCKRCMAPLDFAAKDMIKNEIVALEKFRQTLEELSQDEEIEEVEGIEEEEFEEVEGIEEEEFEEFESNVSEEETEVFGEDVKEDLENDEQGEDGQENSVAVAPVDKEGDN